MSTYDMRQVTERGVYFCSFRLKGPRFHMGGGVVCDSKYASWHGVDGSGLLVNMCTTHHTHFTVTFHVKDDVNV